MLTVGLTGITPRHPRIAVFTPLSQSTLPPLHNPIFGGNFMALSFHVRTQDSEPTESFVELSYGNDRKSFSGMHRFGVFREGMNEEVVVRYSCIAYNPREDKPIFAKSRSPRSVSLFHCFYARCLFRDGTREVLRG
ncbi:hypothetical protein BJ878DRAFT_578537 [Calycina marina]|uniref:Uncharacterized protein n=1 Tax=Calycina marina TaxID=1763456 RepID=A0A9P7YWQ7_9HELO|nr:hypothetical protein BJ878DRAFT_578537 [Calycina marina]